MSCVRCNNQLTTSRQKKYCSKKCRMDDAYHRNYLKYKDQYTRRRIKWREDNPIRTKYLYAKADIKRRGRGGLHISYEKCQELWALGCTYCSKNLFEEKGCSLDRLNNDLGYTVENVVPCCGNCNTVRSDVLTHEEMKIAMTAVLNYRRSHA
jgi:hypothetical protein